MKSNHASLNPLMILVMFGFGLTTLSFLSLTTPSTLADTNVVTSTSITIEESCTLSGITDTAHTADLVNGTYSGSTYSNGIGQTTLKTFCNDDAGYAIYAIGYTNNEYGNTTMHWDRAESLNDNTNAINTGVYVSGTTTSSTWSMKLASVSGTYAIIIDDGDSSNNNSTEDFTNWHVIPSEYKRVAYSTSGTDLDIDGNGVGSSITVTYDTFVSTAQPAGSYTGQVKYTLVHPNNEDAPMSPLDPSLCPAYSVCYIPNANDIIGDMSSLDYTTSTTMLHNASPKAGRQSSSKVLGGGSSPNITSTTTSVELIAPNYKREGYGFAGWSAEFDISDAANPVIYGPIETINTDVANGGIDLSSGLILYPVWIASSGNLQGWSGCSSLTPVSYNSDSGALSASLDSITALTDARDGNVYTVARLADGECWMVENLRLNAEDSRSAEDIAWSQGYGISNTYGNFIGLADSEDANFDTVNPTMANNATNSLYSSDGSTTINLGTSNSPSYRMPRYNNNNTNMAVGATNSDGVTVLGDSHTLNNNRSRWYSYGNYYSWPAAIASTIYYGESDDAETSICPSGWHLPLGNISSGTLSDGASDSANRVGGFSYLDRKMGGTGQNQADAVGIVQSTKWRRFPNNFVYSGIWTRNHPNGRSTSNGYLSSSAHDSGTSYSLSIYSEHIDIGKTSQKCYGYSIRCVAN